MFGKRISEERQRLGWTQTMLAERLGLSRAGTGMIESDRAPLHANRLMDLQKFGFDVLYILTGEPSPVIGGQLLNWELLAIIQKTVRTWSEKNDVVFTPEKEVLIMKLLYSHFAAKGIVDENTLQQTLQLAA